MALKSSGPLGYAQGDVSTVVLLSTLLAIPPGATYVVVTPESDGIRWRDDGTNPTASVGMPLAAGATLSYDGDPAKLRVVAQTGTATVNVAYYASRHP